MPADSNFTDDTSNLPQLLVIDDDVIQRTIIAKIGTQAGYEAAGAASFAEAERLMQRQIFDCVTLDLSLGTNSGVLLLNKLIDTNNHVPIIIISGAQEHIIGSTYKICQSLGLDAQLLNKPLKVAELRDALVQKQQDWVARRGVNAHYRLIRLGANA
jgi:DNA-binding NtrC family response regulator